MNRYNNKHTLKHMKQLTQSQKNKWSEYDDKRISKHGHGGSLPAWAKRKHAQLKQQSNDKQPD